MNPNTKVTAMLVGANILSRLLHSRQTTTDGGSGLFIMAIDHLRSHCSSTTELSTNDVGNSEKKREGKLFTLPPFAKTINASEMGAKLAGKSH
ncbi:hypothetical protein V6N13_117229 [Hibiscus sabdariffa]|uniref:Uncharacterized protein n=1 Tax=Hibiscus sabdariffa TaxID=183260 RepID=A0ABR2P9X7_9ROSI